MHSPERTAKQYKASVIRRLAIALCVFLLSGVVGTPAHAQDSGQTITLGESLTEPQQTELLDVFGSEDGDRIIVITVEDTSKAMEGISMVGTISTAYSSSALKCRDLGDGLDVSTRNISQVTPDLYAIALVTAGIGDATLFVAAPSDFPAGGMTALAGVFKTFELAPCASGSTTPERQRLAIEELAIATSIGQALEASGVVDGMLRAGNIVLETQKTMVTERLKEQAEIEAVVVAQELAQGVTIPAEMRAQLVDMMTRLAAQDIDWSTFSAGWTIERSADNTRVSMTGDGIAIRNARRTATAEAKSAAAQTAEAIANATGTAEAALTQTAAAASDQTATASAATASAEAAMTQAAIDGMTATALAQPTATPTPSATAIPIGLSGTISEVTANTITFEPDASPNTAEIYTLDPGCVISIDGAPGLVAGIKAGSAAQLVLNGETRQVIEISAVSPEDSSIVMPILLGGAGLLMVGMVGTLVATRRRQEPFVVTHRGDR